MWNKLLKFVNLRPRSEKEVNDWFKRKKVSSKDQKKYLIKLRQLEFINDQKFANWWITQRLYFRLKSKKELYFELLKKGISENIIQNTISDFDIDESEIVKKIIQKRHLKGPKGAAYLLRHGFPYEVVKDSLK